MRYVINIKKGIRLDGRKTDEIRPIWCEVDWPSTHGSSIFTRGKTQALATVTLGTSGSKSNRPSILSR